MDPLGAYIDPSLGYLTSGSESLSSQPSIGSQGSFASENGKQNVSGFKVMTVTRGFTEEADKLLDFLVGLYRRE